MVADEAPVLEDPGKGPLDHPAPRQQLETLGVRAAADDLQGNAGLAGSPAHEAAGMAAIGEDAFDKRVALARALERQLAAVAVLDMGAVDADREEPAIGVGQDVPPAPGDLLARIVALLAPFWPAVRTAWLSRIAADGETSRPQRSRSVSTSA